MQHYIHTGPFLLESSATLDKLQIGYHTWGALNTAGDNVIWICHALTANSDAMAWWPGMIGSGKPFDTDRYFVICANILGSCYGTTGPMDGTSPATSLYNDFPLVTIRDMVAAHRILQRHLCVTGIHLLAGGSMGGYQALEWSVMQPGLIKHLFLIATSAKESAWGIAIHAAQRLAIEADSSWGCRQPAAGSKGLKAARAIGMLTYRSYAAYAQTQTDPDENKTDGFKAASYIDYQGSKLVERFNAYSYWHLTKAMDTHNLSRASGRSIADILASIAAKTLVIGIKSDLLCPIGEQQLLAAHIPAATLQLIDSLYGHDGFLVETPVIAAHISDWLSN
jgi:homoserine O-acetyltransferase